MQPCCVGTSFSGIADGNSEPPSNDQNNPLIHAGTTPGTSGTDRHGIGSDFATAQTITPPPKTVAAPHSAVGSTSEPTITELETEPGDSTLAASSSACSKEGILAQFSEEWLDIMDKDVVKSLSKFFLPPVSISVLFTDIK